MSSWYFRSTPTVSLIACGANSSASNCISASVQSIVSAMPGNLNKSILRSFWTNSTTSRDSDSLARGALDRKSTRLNSSHVEISYAVFCLKKKNKKKKCNDNTNQVY